MLKNHLLVAFRNLRRRKGYAALNVAGLALGLACCTLLLLYVRSELAVDSVFPDADRIARVGSRWQEETMGLPITAPAPLGPALVRTDPEVEAQTRLWAGWISLRRPGEPALRRNGYLADPNVLGFFGLPMRYGDAATALRAPRSVVLSEDLAEALFGTADAVGRTVTLETYEAGDQTYTVTGVWAPVPFNSFTDFDGEPYSLVVSNANADFIPQESWTTWESRNLLQFIKLAPGATMDGLAARLDGTLQREAPADLQGGVYHPVLEPLRTLYLDGGEGQNRQAVWLLAGLAVLVLLVACINFANLATARALERAREVGVRKAIGARRSQLVGPLLGEAVLVAGVATVLGAGLARALQGPFFAMAGKPLVVERPWDAPMLLALAGIALAAGLLAGLYPAVVLSGFRPVLALKGQARTGPASVRLRRGLVVVQFAAAVLLLAGTAVVYRQMAYLDGVPLGYSRDHVLVIRSVPRDWTPEGVARLQPVRSELAALPGVQAVSLSWETAAEGGGNTVALYGPDQPADRAQEMSRFIVDESYAEVYGLQMAAGRFFGPGEADGVILNERAAAALGVQEPGDQVAFDAENTAPVVGIVRDFHSESLHEAVRPLVLLPLAATPYYRTFSLRLAPGDVAGTLARVEALWRAELPAAPFDYTFLDDDVTEQYASERRTGTVVGVTAGLAVLVAALGLVGLVSLSVLQRRKEIGVRKVLGAGVPHIVGLFARDFGVLVAVGAAVGVPVTYLLAHRWLEGFAYHVPLGPAPFLLAAGAALALALLLVALQASRAALSDPVKAIRSE